jgi:hypothetical protein
VESISRNKSESNMRNKIREGGSKENNEEE